MLRYLTLQNTIVAIQFHAIHFNENLWGPTVNEFRPERFLDEKMNIINSEKVFAFGYGITEPTKYYMIIFRTRIFYGMSHI